MYQQTRLAQAIAFSMRSFPQNNSPSVVTKVGAPNISRRCASAVCARSFFFDFVCSSRRQRFFRIDFQL
jgi:hypothetical protein